MPCRYLHWVELASHRQSSEDRAEVFPRGDELIVVVGDGVGGLRGGARASAALVETVRAVAENPALDVHDVDMWTDLLREADATLATRRIGETTAAVVVVGPGGLTGISAGDSEAWIVGTASLDDLTRSQEKGRLGSGRAKPLSFQRRKLDGTLLVATDGLFRYASAGRILSTIRSGEVSRAAERLIALARLPSGGFQDDLGIAVVAAA